MEFLKMEFLNLAIVSNNPFFLSLILLSSVLIFLKLSKRSKLNLPPSPPKLPIIGNMHQLGELPHRSLRDLSKNYGSVLRLHVGSNPMVLISSADMVKEIVKNHDVVFSDRPITIAADVLFYGCKDITFSPYGEYWRRVRKMCVVELFSPRRVHSFHPIRHEEVELIVDKIRCACLKGESVNLTEMLTLVSSNIVSRSVFSQKSEEEQSTKFGHMTKKLLMLSASFGIGDLFPILKWIDVLTGRIPSINALHEEFDAFLDQVIQERGKIDDDKKDFVSIITQLQKDGILEMNLTQDNIKAILLNMFVGGVDTTITTSEWMMSELLKHPNVMKKVQQQVRNVMNNKSKVDMEDINKMDYLKCVLKETLRLHPAAPLLAPRLTSADVKLGGYDIPKGTTIMVNGWAIHRDPKWWPEKPEEFIPERFENSNIDFKGYNFQYVPFGFGRRQCPGLPFGVAAIEYVMANLLYWFDWKLPAGQNPENFDMTERNGVTVTKKTPINVIPISRISF